MVSIGICELTGNSLCQNLTRCAHRLSRDSNPAPFMFLLAGPTSPVPNSDRDAGHDGSRCAAWEKKIDKWSHRSRKLNFEGIEHFHPKTRNLKSPLFGLWNGAEQGVNTQLFFSDCLLETFRPSYWHHNKNHSKNSVSESFTQIRWKLILLDLMQYQKMKNGN